MTVASVQPHWPHPAHGWRPLHGDFARDGLSIEWHDFRAEEALNWGETFRPQSVEFCLNMAGRGAVGRDRANGYVAGSAGYYALANEPLPATRRAHDRHQFITVEFARPELQRQLANCAGDLEPQVRRAIFPEKSGNVVSAPRTMTNEQRNVVSTLLQPPVPRAARALWYQGKAMELMAHFLFAPKDPEMFCMRQKRVARDRVERTKELLARDLTTPPSLESLGQEVGCSPFHLSRIFSREVGLTIPQFLRNLRMERAAELLRSGRFNVTEAAIEVGYSSLSHFSKAFCETIGCCPALYPMAKHVVLDR